MKAKVPGFRDNLPDCGGGKDYPSGWAEAYCPWECETMCRISCRDESNPARCEKKCGEECMNECLFVPCCNRYSLCDDGWEMQREECQYSYYSGVASAVWVATGNMC
ncbi:hypothetical protein [Streptomyces sp. CB00316]|uniref:hypothetical protein n=1 Tax=Streptomyces sp. CB00316 TaxID=1703932 RepID=UPI000A68C984|nr:hypothetical protein [Streptomyces sp. CB00316]